MSDRQSGADPAKDKAKRDEGGNRPDLSLTQLVASGLATVIAAVGASRLGVAGTIIGAAFMSVVSTACSVLMRHYMDRGKEQVLEFASGDHPLIVAHPPRADPVETKMDITRVRPDPLHADPTVTRWDLDVTRLDTYRLPEVTEPVGLPEGPGTKTRRPDWLPGWRILAAGAAAIFVVVLGGLVAVEAVTGVPPSKLPGGGGGNGASFIPGDSGHTTPNNNDQSPSRTPGEQVTPTAPRSQRPDTGGGDSTPSPNPTTTNPEHTSSPTPKPSQSGGGSERPNPPSQPPPPAGHGAQNGQTGTSG